MEKEVMTFKTEAAMDVKSIPSDLFRVQEHTEKLHDQAFETKPISYLRGAFMRFAKNKASIVADCLTDIGFVLRSIRLSPKYGDQ